MLERFALTQNIALFFNTFVLSAYSDLVSTIAGGGGSTVAGYVDGMGTASRFNTPEGIYSTSAGDIIVGDTYNHLIRKITSTGNQKLSILHSLAASLSQ